MQRSFLLRVLLTAVAVVMLSGAAAQAQDVKQYVVLPFTYQGPQKYSYFPKAFQASLRGKLEWAGHVQPMQGVGDNDVPTPKSGSEAITLLQGLGADYMTWGTISILGDQAQLDLEVRGADGAKWSTSDSVAINEITGWLDRVAADVQGDVFNRPGYGKAAEKFKTEAAHESASGPGGANFLAADTGDPKAQDAAQALNPQFRYEGGNETPGRWRSQLLRYPSTSMVVCDGDGDGKNEVFLLTENKLVALRYDDGKLVPLAEMPFHHSLILIRLEAIDLDRDGVDELVVGGYHQMQNLTELDKGEPRSHIISFNGGKFSYLLKNEQIFLGVLRLPPTYLPVLVEQRKGTSYLFDKYIYEAALSKDGDLIRGQKVLAPEFGNVYNLTYLPDGEMGYKYVVLTDSNKIKIYSQALELLASTEETYNSSTISVETTDRPYGMGQAHDILTFPYSLPIRMMAISLLKQGKWELLVNKDLSVAAQVFDRYRYFSQGELHAMYWDGVGLNLSWKTRRIKGSVNDYGIADVDNDGDDELCVLVNTFPGVASMSRRKTMVLGYELNME